MPRHAHHRVERCRSMERNGGPAWIRTRDTTDYKVRNLIRHGGDSCELYGKVIYAHKGWGMGILFGEVAGEQCGIFERWLGELQAKLKYA